MTEPMEYWFDRLPLDQIKYGLAVAEAQKRNRRVGSLIRFMCVSDEHPPAFQKWWHGCRHEYYDRSLGQLEVHGLLGERGLVIQDEEYNVTDLDSYELYESLIVNVEDELVTMLTEFHEDCGTASWCVENTTDRPYFLREPPIRVEFMPGDGDEIVNTQLGFEEFLRQLQPFYGDSFGIPEAFEETREKLLSGAEDEPTKKLVEHGQTVLGLTCYKNSATDEYDRDLSFTQVHLAGGMGDADRKAQNMAVLADLNQGDVCSYVQFRKSVVLLRADFRPTVIEALMQWAARRDGVEGGATGTLRRTTHRGQDVLKATYLSEIYKRDLKWVGRHELGMHIITDTTNGRSPD